MHTYYNKNYLSDRRKVEHAVPMMLLSLMINSTVKPKEEGRREAEIYLELISEYVGAVLSNDIVRRRAAKVYKDVSSWMMKGKFSTRKGMYVVLQFVYLLAESNVLFYERGTPFYDALDKLGEIYDNHLVAALGNEYPQFEKGVMKAVLQLATKMQSMGYFQQVEFKKAA